MKIRDIVSAGKISFSCEVFPPKKESEFAPIESAVREIALLRPDFMSVTCGAGGSAGGTTGAVASLIKNGCYPEGHPESPSRAEDIRRLKEKVDCGLDFLTTQMFFDNSVLYSFLSRIRAAGVHVPVLAGIMPVTNAKQIGRIIALSGTSLPPRFRMILDKFGGNSAAMKQAGIAYATEQIIDLVANGVEGIHLYTMNKPDIAARIKASLSDILG
jgi:5,10-methylenetetrahydrofolate reductase